MDTNSSHTKVNYSITEYFRIILDKVWMSHKILYGIMGVGLFIGLLLLGSNSLIVDEITHLKEIKALFQGKYAFNTHITVPVTYHFIVAFLAKALFLNIDSYFSVRIVSFLGAAYCIFIFNVIARRISPIDSHIRTLQFVFFPLIFPYFFLIYTDIWALCFILLSTERAFAKKIWQSALAISLAILIRPPNIVFTSLPFFLLFFSEISLALTFKKAIGEVLKKLCPFFLVGVGFIIFVLWNGGIAIGSRTYHYVSFNLSNIWFFFLLFSLMFFPICCSAWKQINSVFSGHYILKIIGGCLFFLLYYFTYHVSHPANDDIYFIRNNMLHFTTNSLLIKIFTFLPVTLGAIGFLCTPLLYKKFQIVLPIICLVYILPFSLIESRYYIPALTLFLLFRQRETGIYEAINTIFYILCSLILLLCIAKHICFL